MLFSPQPACAPRASSLNVPQTYIVTLVSGGGLGADHAAAAAARVSRAALRRGADEDRPGPGELKLAVVSMCRVQRAAAPGQEAIEFRGEFLQAFANAQRVRSHLPVVVRRGSTELRADGVDYDHLARRLDFVGKSRAVFAPAGGAR